MRLAGLTLAVALAAAAPAAATQTAVRAVATGTGPASPLASEEVLLELDVTGVPQRPGDAARTILAVYRSGATPAEARAGLARDTGRIAAAASAAGVAAGDIRVVPVDDIRAGFVGNAALEAIKALSSPPVPRHYGGSASVEIRFRDPAAYERVREAVETSETAAHPIFNLSDQGRAWREARADALRKARAEAEDYARAVGMRVGRLVRVSAGNGSGNEAHYELLLMMGCESRDPGVVETVRRSAPIRAAPTAKASRPPPTAVSGSAKEYGPSLLHVDSGGRLLGRWVPEGSNNELLLVSDDDFGIDGAQTTFWHLRFDQPIA